MRAVTLFAQSCPSLQRGPEALTREQIEAHLAHLAVRYPDAKTRTGQIGTLASLLRAARQHCWERASMAGLIFTVRTTHAG